jgi:hypothetical protein
MEDLRAHPPVYVVIATADATPLEELTSKQQIPHFADFAAFLEAGYAFDQRIGDFEIYLRVD